MAHIHRDQEKLLVRIRRIRGQVDALEQSIATGTDCTKVLQQIAACRGAINGLMSTVLEGHVREHLIDPSRAPTKAEALALEDLVGVLRSYFK